MNRVHFIGIGGIGTSALARWFLAKGWTVTGSDIERTALTDELAREGATVRIGRQSGRVPGHPSLVVYTNAVRPDNAEFRDAKRRGIPLLPYPAAVAEVAREYDMIAVAGAHGKSTTTALAALALVRGGLDPTVLIGTKLREFGGKNFREGKSGWLVLEADEYARAFLHYAPTHLVVTNIDREHLDCYDGLADIKKTFLKLFSQVRPGGTLVLNADDAHVTALRGATARIARARGLRVLWYSRRDPAAKKIAAALRIPGAHNASNALAAFTLATKVLHIPAAKALAAIGSYRGSWRRYEHKGSFAAGGIRYEVFDDYAHHPTEIRATLAAFREKFPAAALVCIFQPHQAERLKRLFSEFSTSFKDAHGLMLVPAYHVAGRENKETKYTAEALAAAVAKKSPRLAVRYLSRPERISRKEVEKLVAETGSKHKKAVVVMMGAGTIANYTPLLLGGSRKSARRK